MKLSYMRADVQADRLRFNQEYQNLKFNNVV